MINCSRFLNMCTQPARSDSNICGFVFRLLCVVATIIRMLSFLCRNYCRNNSFSYYAVQLIREMKKRDWLTYISNDSASESLMIQKKYIISTARSIKRRCWYCSLLFYCGFRLIADHIVTVQFGGKISSFVSRLYTCVILDGCALAVWRGQVRREIRSEPETLRFHLPLFNWIRTILFFTFLNSLGVATIVSNSDDTFFSHVNNFSI